MTVLRSRIAIFILGLLALALGAGGIGLVSSRGESVAASIAAPRSIGSWNAAAGCCDLALNTGSWQESFEQPYTRGEARVELHVFADVLRDGGIDRLVSSRFTRHFNSDLRVRGRVDGAAKNVGIRIVGGPDGEHYALAFWFEMGGHSFTRLVNLKLASPLAFVSGRSNVAAVLVSARCPDSACLQAIPAINDFVDDVKKQSLVFSSVTESTADRSARQQHAH